MIFSGYNSTVPIPPATILIIFPALFIAQFVVPAYFRIQYLGRLPVDENSTAIFVSCTGSSGTNGIKSSNSSNGNTGRLLKPAPKETVCGKMD